MCAEMGGSEKSRPFSDMKPNLKQKNIEVTNVISCTPVKFRFLLNVTCRFCTHSGKMELNGKA